MSKLKDDHPNSFLFFSLLVSLSFLSLSALMAAQQQRLRGYVLARIVGMRFEPGDSVYPRPRRRHVLAVSREFLNPFDSNALALLNPRQGFRRIGYLIREISAILAPLVDSGEINLGVVVGKYWDWGNVRNIPCQVMVFSVNRRLELSYYGVSRNFELYERVRYRDFTFREFEEILAHFAQAEFQDQPLQHEEPVQEEPVPPPVQEEMMVPPPVQEEPVPTPVQEEPVPPPVYVGQQAGGMGEEWEVDLQDVSNYLAQMNPTEMDLLKNFVNRGGKLGRAPFWPDSEPDLEEELDYY